MLQVVPDIGRRVPARLGDRRDIPPSAGPRGKSDAATGALHLTPLPRRCVLPRGGTVGRVAAVDVPTPAEIDALVREVAARAEPCARLLLAPRPGLRAPVAVLSGAFDPPTRAHAALARAALRRGMATLLFAIAVQTVDKERGTRADVGLRLTLLCRYARRRPRLGVLVCKRGLYLEQAAALAELGVD